MKTIALLSAFVAVALAPVAGAATGDASIANGVSMYGRSICAELRKEPTRESLPYVVNQLVGKGFTVESAAYVVGQSVITYCPEQVGPIQQVIGDTVA